MLLVGNVTVASGAGHYFGDILMGDDRAILGSMNLLAFVVIVAILEASYRIRNKFALGHITKTIGNTALKNYTPEEVDAHVKDGKKLVLFDNAVLDINGYERNHPGGKFNLVHNFGRDISKFFYGGYNLVNVEGKRPHHHSQGALDIVKSMIVGVLKSQEQVQDH